MNEKRAEKATFYTSPAVMSEAQPGSGEGLSDGPHEWSCAAVPSTATWAKDTGRVCGSSQPAQHGAASETSELVHLMALCAVPVRGWGTPAWLCAWAPCPYLKCGAAGTQLCSWPGQPQRLAGIMKHQRGPRDLPEVPLGACSRAKVQAPTQPAPGECRATLVPAKQHQPSQCTGERGDTGVGH